MRKSWKRLVALLCVLLLITSVTACENKSGNQGEKPAGEHQETEELVVKEGIPTYKDDVQIELSAYSGPRKAGYRNFNNNPGSHPDDPEGGWEGWITEEAFQDYKDCGFTYLLADFDAMYDTNVPFEGSATQEYMELAEKMGLEVIISSEQLTLMTSSDDYRLNDDLKTMLSEMVENLSQYECFKGFSFRDEPNYPWAKTFGAVQDYLLEKNPDLFFFTSLLPIYGDPTRFTDKYDGSTVNAYNDYIDAFGGATGAFFYDSYPLYLNPISGETRLDDTWLQNLCMVAESAKEKEFEKGITIQSCAFGEWDKENVQEYKRATNTKEDIGFQVYSSLAYGMKYITYFTYWEHINSSYAEEFYSSMVMYPKKKGEDPIKTDAYYAVKEVNEEIKKFDHVFLKYDWEGTMAVTKEGAQKSLMLAQAGDYTSPRIESVTATDETIIGCMKDAEGYDGFMIVNVTDPGKKLSDSVTVTFKKATKAIVYVQGEEQTVELENGTYTFDLASGEGVFVIPIV